MIDYIAIALTSHDNMLTQYTNLLNSRTLWIMQLNTFIKNIKKLQYTHRLVVIRCLKSLQRHHQIRYVIYILIRIDCPIESLVEFIDLFIYIIDIIRHLQTSVHEVKTAAYESRNENITEPFWGTVIEILKLFTNTFKEVSVDLYVQCFNVEHWYKPAISYIYLKSENVISYNVTKVKLC